MRHTDRAIILTLTLATALVLSALPAQAGAACSYTFSYPSTKTFHAQCAGANSVDIGSVDLVGQPLLIVCDVNSGVCVQGCGALSIVGTDNISIRVVPIGVDDTTGSACVGSVGSISVQFH